MNPHSSVILCPTYRGVEPETRVELEKLQKRGYKVEERYGDSEISSARARMATLAIIQGYEWLYWIDSDIQFRSYDFDRLEAWGGKFSCGPYAIKGKTGAIAVLGADSESKGLVQVEAAGFGFMKTHRSIYEAMMKVLPTCQQSPGGQPLIPFFQPRWWKRPDGRNVYYGEDYSFCLHAAELGFQLMANFDIRLGHIGRYAYKIGEKL